MRWVGIIWLLLAVLCVVGPGCGEDSRVGGDGLAGDVRWDGAGAGGSGDAGDVGGDGAGPGSRSDASGSDVETGSGAGGDFRYGINLGHPNGDWGDEVLGQLAWQMGSRSIRAKLHEVFLDEWGYDIRTPQFEAYEAMGMRDLVVFLIGPSAEHSSAPAGTSGYLLEHYIPKNLYEPVFGSDGKINPQNYWAQYVYQTVKTYKRWVKIWEIWNEPDWVSDWRVSEAWATRAPSSEDLPRFNGSVYEYIRMLRVSKLAAQAADPEAQIALGGIGYANFLDAILRYTDNPRDGSATDEYPETGAAYFDVLNYHYYPIYTPGNSNAGVAGFLAKRDEFARVMQKYDVPEKPWHVTETGAPHTDVVDTPGGEAYGRNYLLKVMTVARREGFWGVDWFGLSDDDSDPANPYGNMGFYEDLSKVSEPDAARPTNIGYASETLSILMEEVEELDAAATAALNLSETVDGAVFRYADGRLFYILWASAEGDSEQVSATHTLGTTAKFLQYQWDFAHTLKTIPRAAENGELELELSAEPTMLVERR